VQSEPDKSGTSRLRQIGGLMQPEAGTWDHTAVFQEQLLVLRQACIVVKLVANILTKIEN
jgi:hypothetical protein